MSEQHKNELGQQIGAPLPDWSARPLPPRIAVEGRFCRVEPLDADRHAADLFAANGDDRDGRNSQPSHPQRRAITIGRPAPEARPRI